MDWKEIYQQKKNGTYTPTPTATPASTGTTSATTGASDWRSIYEQKQNAKGSDVNAWISAANALISDYNTSSSMWEEEGEGFNSYLSERERLLTYADTFRNQYAGNEEALKYVDEVVGVLDSLPVNLFKTWDDVWRDKYQGQSHDELQSVLGDLEEGSDERKWLEEYSWSGDVMTVDDYQKLIDEKEAELDFFKKNNAVDGYATANDEQGNLHGTYDDEIAAAKAELERLKTGQWRLENEGKYGAISQNADFASMSAPRLDEYGKWGNSTYHYINDENVQKAASAQGMRAGGARSEERKGYDLMTEDEVEMYNYLYHVSGKKAAEEYLDYLSYELAARRTQQISDVNAQIATDSPWLASAMSIPANLMSGIGYVDVAGQNVVKGITEAVTGEYAGPINYNSAAMAPSVMSTSIRSTVAQNLANKHGVIALDVNEHPVLSRVFNGKSWGDVYQLGMSMADSTTTALLAPFIGTAGTVLLGGSAATQGMLDAVANGATDGQALTVGFINGAAEWAFEKIGMDNLVNKIIRGDKAGIVRALISQGLAEGGEELGTSIVNTIADHLIMAEKSGYSRMIEEYKAQGMSPEEAAKRALQDIAIGMGWDFVGGMLSGGIMGGGGHVIGSTIQNAEAKKLYGSKPTELVERVLELDPNNAFAQEMQSKLDSGKKLSGSEIRRLAQQAGDTKGSQESFDTEEAVEDDLTELDETEEDTLEDEYVSEQEMDEGTGPINVDEYSRIVEQAQIEEASEESSVTEQQVEPITVAENATVQEPMAVEENAMSTQESVTEAREAPAAQSLEIEDELDAALAFLDAAPKYESSESTKAVEQTAESREAPAKATTIEEASKKYGAQAKAMSRTYHAGQDVAKYDAAYSKVFEIGKANGSLSFAKKMASAAYLTEAQVELAYEAGQAAAGIQPKTESAKPGAVSEKDEFISDTLASFKNVYGNDIVISDEEIRSVLGEAFDRGENMVQAAKAAKKANQAAIDAQVSAKYETQRKANEEARAKKEAEAAKEAETYADDDWGAWDDEPTSTKSEETEVQTETFTGVDVERTEYSPEDAQKTIQSILNSNKEGRGDIKAEEISCIIDNTYLRDAFAAEAGYTLPWERSKAARAIFEASDTDSSKWSEVSAEGFKRSDILADDRTKDGDLMPAMFANAAGMLLVENGLDVPWNIDALSDSEAVEILQSRKPGKGAYAQELARMTANIRARSVSLSGNQNSRLVDQKFAGDKVSTPQMAVLAYVPRILDGDGNARMSTAEWIKQAFNTGNEGDYAEGIDSLIYDYAQALRVKELIRGGTRLGQLEGKVPQKILDLYRAIEERGLYAKVTPHGSVQGGINEPGRIKVDRKPVAQSKQAPRTANETKAPAAPKATAAKPAASTKVTQTATKAVITAKNEEVSIKRIASVENGEMTLELADGRIISANDVSITADGEALIYETVASMGVDAEAANKLVSGYDSSITAEAYAAGIQEAFEYGRYDTFERMEADKRLAKTLTAEQRRTAFEIGQKAKETRVKSDEAAIKGAYEKAKAVIGDGKKARLGELVYEDGIKERSLTKAQKTVADEGRIISAALGVNVHIYSGMAEYGYCSKETGDIWLNVNANISGQTLMQTTMSHELVHTVRERAPAKFQAFADFLVSEYSKKGVSIKKLMIAKQQEYAENGIELTADDAYEEVIAEAASTMLTDSNAVKRLAELNKDHPDIVTMIREFFQDLLSRIQSLFGQMPADSYEAQLVRQMEQETQKILQNLYADMLIDAGKYNTTIKQAFGKNTTIETNAEGEFLLAKNNGGSESPAKYMYNAATWESGGRDTLAAALKREGFSAKDIKAALTIMDAKYELVKQLGQEYTEQERINQIEVSTDIKDGHSVVSALVTNGDYPVNIDLLMVCKKRQAYQKVINRLCETGMIQKATVDSLAIAEINKILGKYGFETACLGCFVESRRLRVQEWAETICKEWNAEVKKRNPNADAFGFGNGEVSLTQEEVMQLVAELESGGEKNDQGNLNLGRGSAVKRMGVLLDKVPSLQKTLTVEDLLTPQGLTALRQYDSNLFSMVKSRYGSNSPKYVQDFNPYNSELAKYGKVPSEYKDLREYLYAIGGARMQSFSDFIVENWFDYCQIVADLAARKLPMHTYTKEIALVKLFGMTGIKVNMSLIPDIDRSLGKEYAGLTLNENGEYELIWADKDRYKATGGKTYMQSINFADAIALQEDPRYSSNVGTIAVGISDKHIEMMLDDSRIRMIIPYHSSGMNPIYADMVGSSFYKDYTATQNTTVAYLLDSKGNRKSLTLTKEQAKKLTAGFEFNQTLQDLGDARATAEAYKAWCRDASKHTITIKGETYTAVLTPKFSQFAYHDNYYKLLEDFNCYDCITEQAAPQGDVTQTYPEAFEDILREEVQAREDYRQKQDPKFNDAMAEIESFLEHHSKADSVYYAEQRGIKLGAKDKKLSAAEKAKLAELKAKDTGKGKTMYRMPPKADPAFSSKTAKAVEVFGTTTDFNEAGFILPGGEMLRFTDDKHKGERQYDHRAIGMAYGVDVELRDNHGFNEASAKHLEDFIENGSIRFDPGDFDLDMDAGMQLSSSVPLTKKQERTIREFIEWKQQREENIVVDEDSVSLYSGPLALHIEFGGNADIAVSQSTRNLDAWGIKHLSYEGGQINADRIIADIRHYYQTGETRQPSSLAQFRYRMPSRSNKQIMRGMTDEERYELLKDKKIALHAKVDMRALKAAEDKIGQATDIADGLSPAMRRNLFRTVGREFGVFKQYYSQDFKLTFAFGTGNMRHSLNKQGKNYHDFAKMLTCFDDVIGNAIGIEVHNRNDDGYKPDPTLDNVYVLVSAFEDGDRIVPVKLEVKEFSDKENTLYVAVSLESIKKDEVVAQGGIENDADPDARSSEIMISDLFAKINPIDTSFLKYVPKQFLETGSVGQAGTARGNGAVMTKDRIDYLIADSGAGSRTDYAQKWITSINPTDFLNMTLGKANQDRAKFDTMPGDYDTSVNDYDFIEGGLKKSRQTPYLAVDINTGEVVGHEGRHRMRALEKEGITYAEIAIEFRDEDGRVIKELNGYGKALETIESLTIYNQRGTGQSTVIRDIIPLNRANRDAVLQKYGVARDGDIRYRQGTEASLNTRQLLANAFESVAQNDIERERIREYKKKIDLVNAEEQKLQRLRAEIKKLSFAKGPRDAKRISKLQDEATKTANRISVYDQQLLRLEASKPLQAVVEREKTKAKKLAEKKGREALAAYREKAAQTQQKMLERYRESRSNAKIGRDKTAMRHKIKDIVDELNNYLLKGTKDKHVMIGLQKAVASALDVVNMDTVGAEERLKALSEKMAKETDPIKLNDLLASYRRIMEQGEKMSEKLQNLRAAYAEIKDSSDPLIANSHDEVIEAAIEAVAKNVGETPLRDMTLEQLQDVYDLYKMVLTTIRTSNKSFKADKKKSIDSLASSVQAEVEEVGGKKKFGLKNFGAVNSFLWNNFKPVYAFKAIGSKTLSRLFNNVRAGEDVWAKDVSAAKAFYLEQSKKHGYDSWDLEKTHTFTSTTGMDFKLTLEQIMSLYAYSKRKQAEDHLKFGGIVFEDSFETKKLFGKFDIKLKTEDATAYNISPETLAAITATLTADQKAFVDAMQDYLSTTMGEKGNEVSLEMYGVKLFKEKFYFPLKSATQYMAKAREQAQGDVKIKNKGFTKDTNPKAKNPIVLESFMDVWASHVNEMSMYHAFTLPLEDFYRVYNYKTPSVNENMPTEGVNPAIQNAYGKAATKYIEQLLRDLNGGARSDPTAGFINKMMGLFKKGAVFASASVVIQQPSAIARAMALVDSKYFVGKKLDDHKHKALWEEVKQYAPVAMIKEMGYFDTNMGMSTVDFIKAKEYESWDEKMKALVTDGDYRDEVLSKAPALADEIAWCMIWEAVKRETIDKHPALKATSEEFLQLAGARFTEVIVNTQVYDSVLSRSANMRSKDTGMKMATAFLAEPTTNINMIADALVQGKRGDKKQARKAIGAVMASQILNAILVSFVYAGRDDDDEKTYWEKYFASVLGEVKDSFNLASYIPFLKDIVSIVQGYDVERSDIAVIADIWKAYEQLDSDSLSGWRKVENFVGGIASLFGLPVKNIMRDARALYQTVDLAINGEKTTAAGMKYAIKEALTGEEVKNADQLLEALIDGDEAHAERVMGRFEDESKANTALRSSIKSGFTGGRFDADAAVEMLVDYTDMDEDDAYWKVQEWLAGGEEFSRYGRVFDAVRNGGNFDSAMDELVAHGYDEKEVLSKVKGQIGTWYKEGEITRQQATQMLGRYMDMESEDITKTVDKWEFARDYGYAWEDRSEAYSAGEISREELITSMMEVHDIDRQDAEYEVAYLEFQMNYPEFDLAKSTYLAYHRDIDKIGMSLAEAGIDIGVYAMYSENKKGVSGKANILPIIDALPITPAQKDAIYYKEGWASSTIWDTPWHR